MSRLADYRPGVLVLLAGACSMGLEIVAGRMLTPTFGNSVYTWGSTIGIFLTALSLGYYLGGRYSDRASMRSVSWLLGGAAIFSCFILLYGSDVITWAGELPYAASRAVLVPLIVVFGPPTALIGFISPFTAELVRPESTGEASGRVYALGTIGSILGTFATTFVLIPSMTTQTIIGLFAGVLAAGAVIARPWRHLLPGILLFVLIGSTLYIAAPELRPGTIYHTQSAYQQITVTEDDGIRKLYLNGALNSGEYMDAMFADSYSETYPPYLHIPQAMLDDVDDALFIGGGAFSVPKRYVDDGVNVTVVEIDPQVVDVAERFFRLNRSRYDIRVMDGRRFLSQTDETYDVIIVDAFHGHTVPFHLTTKEFLQLTRQHLDDPGVVLSNIVTAWRGPSADFYRSELATFQRVFPHVYAFSDSNPYIPQSLELVGTKGLDRFNASELAQDPVVDQYKLQDEISFMRYPEPSQAAILRDDQAPVETLTAE